MIRRFVEILFVVGLIGAQTAQAAVVVVSVTGSLNAVVDPLGWLPGVSSTDGFALEFRFDTDPAFAEPNAFIDVDEVGYEFAGGAYGVSGSIGTFPVNFQRVNAGLADNENLTVDEAPPGVPPGLYDGFALAGQSSDGDFDMATGDFNNGTLLGIALYGPTDIYSSAFWYQDPPSLGPLIGTYMAYGVMLNGTPLAGVQGTLATMDIQIVPLPAAAWLMGSALFGLCGIHFRRLV